MTKRLKRTPTFNGYTKPVRVGWYETQLPGDNYWERRYWSGSWWSCWDLKDTPSMTQTWCWRGLAAPASRTAGEVVDGMNLSSQEQAE